MNDITDSPEWYYTQRDGSQAGPITRTALTKLIATNAIPSSAMVWKPGMTDWSAIPQCPELLPKQEDVTSPSAPDSPQEVINPYASPLSNPSSETTLTDDTPVEYPGLSRLPYFVRIVVSVFVMIVVMAAMMPLFTRFDNPILVVIGVVGIIGFLVYVIRLHSLRLKNIGVSPWFLLLMLVPLVSNLLSIALLACPTGYAQTRKLDTAGKITAGVLIILTILSLGANIFRATAQFSQ